MDTIVYSLSKQRIMALICAAALALGLGFGMAACSSDSSGNQQQSTPSDSPAAGTVKMEIDASSVDGGKTEIIDVDIPEGATAFDVLEKSGVDFTAEDGQYGKYIVSLGGLAQGDKGSMSGWLVLVNGESAQVAPDKCEVKDGDTVTWYYTADGTMPE